MVHIVWSRYPKQKFFSLTRYMRWMTVAMNGRCNHVEASRHVHSLIGIHSIARTKLLQRLGTVSGNSLAWKIVDSWLLVPIFKTSYPDPSSSKKNTPIKRTPFVKPPFPDSLFVQSHEQSNRFLHAPKPDEKKKKSTIESGPSTLSDTGYMLSTQVRT